MRKSENWQKKRIHIAKSQLGLDDAEYRLMMKREYNVESSKDLLYFQATKFMQELERAVFRIKKKENQPSYKKYDYLLDQPIRDEYNFAVPGQLRKIEKVWQIYSREKSKSSLEKFSKRITGKKLLQLKKKDVKKLIRAIESLK